MTQRIFSHFQDYLIQYISHQYQNLLYCNSSQYMLSTYNSHHNNNNVVHYVFNPDHYIGIVIATTTLLYKYILFPIIGMCYIHYVQIFYCYSAFHMFSMFYFDTK